MSARRLGEQLTEALAAANPDKGWTIFPSYAVGYLEGLLSEIAESSPKARKLIEDHIALQRAKVARGSIQ